MEVRINCVVAVVVVVVVADDAVVEPHVQTKHLNKWFKKRAAGKGASNGASEYLKVPTMIGGGMNGEFFQFL